MSALLALAIAFSVPTGHQVVQNPIQDGLLGEIILTNGAAVQTPFEAVDVPTAGGPSVLYRAEQLWVDRNHRNAIANEAVMNGPGTGIFASWYLNNERLARYVTLGAGEPMWEYPAPSDNPKMDVAAGSGSDIFSASSSALGSLVWLTPSSNPSASFGPASVQDVSDDGSYLVYVPYGTAKVRCVDVQTGSQLWESDLVTTGYGLYGVEICADGSRVAVTVYDSSDGVHVYDMSDGSMVGSTIGNYSQTKADISGDGSRLVTGDFHGYVTLYEFDGSSWSQEARIPTGDSWVTSVGISDDGRTVACGTLAFNPYAGKAIAVDWPASGSPSMLWEYQQYGDEVSSVDLSDDGQIIAAGSWGQYGGTFGDVVTVFDYDGNVIFNLLDDVDEPGSIYSVDVSEDGSYVTASGKAVHARQMGNGGEVYSLRIVEAGNHDVAVTAVAHPQENQQVGNVVSPEVTVTNVGQSTESFDVISRIYPESGPDAWSDTSSVSNLAPGSSQQVYFQDWTVPDYGEWTFEAVTTLSGDVFPENDTLRTVVRAYHDAAAEEVVRPYDENTVLMSFPPLVEVKNNGTYSESFDATLTISLGGTQVYQEQATTSVLGPAETEVLELPSWAPADTGSYYAELTVNLADDYVPGNDNADKNFHVSYEIIYEDGSWETYYWVGSLDDDMFAVRFTPMIEAPYQVTEGRLYVNSTEMFSWGGLFPDDGTGLPDISDPFQLFDSLSVSSAPAWLEVPFDVWIEQAQDLWFVTHWPDAKALGVGTDTEDPKVLRSWWHNASSGWTYVTYGDWSFRLTVEPATGIGSGQQSPMRFELGTPFPNPAAQSLSLPVFVPSSGGRVTMRVYDLAGRLVAMPVDGSLDEGRKQLRWNLRGTDGTPVASGLYIVRVTAGDIDECSKVMVLR
ncbi:T9SS type A sorting domain-containing protein [Candidatus Fermentibacteria bacterium]|nr:T9SS type A sorting domain-containing protein [Candidatus Fermentibacteria bacterium]